MFSGCHSKTSFYWDGDPRSQEYRPRRRCEAGPAAPKPMAPGNDATFMWRHAVDRRFGAAVDSTRRCRHPIPASLLSATPVPAFCSCPSYSGGLSRVRPPPSNREIGTLSDSALEPSSRRPAPGRQPIRFWLGSRTLVWCLPARSRLCERTNEALDLPTTRGRQKPPEPSDYAVFSFGETTLRRPSLRPIRSALSSKAPIERSHNRC